MLLYSPLEQFEILPLFSLGENIIFFSFHNSALSLILFFAISLIVFLSALSFSYFIPTKFQYVMESIYEFVFSMLKQQAGIKSYALFPFLFTVFIFIALSNGFGLIPFSFTATSHIVITFFLALVFNLSFIFLGFSLHGLKFLTLFVPQGVPSALKPLLVVIELIRI
jgi:ATP synthase subunit 6